LIASSLLYGSEIMAWSGVIQDMETVARTFYKKVLGLPQRAKNTATDVIVGRVPLEALARHRALNYWLRLVRLPDSKIVKRVYTIRQNSWLSDKLGQENRTKQ